MFQCDPPPQVTGEWNPRGSPCITRAKNIARKIKKKKRESHHVSPGVFSGFTMFHLVFFWCAFETVAAT